MFVSVAQSCLIGETGDEDRINKESCQGVEIVNDFGKSFIKIAGGTLFSHQKQERIKV